MAISILATKLFVPPPRPKVVPRPRLIERLNESLRVGRKMTLIAAPAGFGKTTLLSDWIAGSPRPAAWLSLDESDNDPARFLRYLVAALQTVDAGIGAEALSLLQSRQPLSVELTLTALINEVAAMSQDISLVLDDYHLIEIQPIHAALTFLLDHLPRQLHLAIASRADPPLPLARLRARGELTELRAADLRFTPDEASAFLNQVVGLGLSAEAITALETRTEGWIAGLQMAALSMQGRPDSASFVQAFTGSHRYIIDYLVEEVLQRQPEPIRRFLLQTAILERLSGPLCEAVSGQADGTATLHGLERANLFVVPLDDRREWYRYHHLFADVLRARLREAQPEQVPALHQRASGWYAQNDLPVEAVQHALAAQDFERAASLVELGWPAVARSRQDATMRAWLKALPDALIRRRPVLSVYVAGTVLIDGDLEAVESRLRDAELWLAAKAETSEDTVARSAGQGVAPSVAAPSVAAPSVASEEELRKLPAQIAIYRAALAQARGDVAGTVQYAQQAFDRLQAGDHLGRGGAAGFLGLALWASGDLGAAQRTFADAMTSLQLAGNLADAISGVVVLADLQIGQGRLREARRILEQAAQMAAAQGAPAPQATGDLYVGLSELLCEHNDLAAATEQLLKSQALGERASLSENRYRWPVAMARIRAAQGDPDAALDWLDQAQHLYLRGFYPEVRPIAAMQARIWLAQGRLAQAQAWAQARGLTVADEPSYLREFEHLTLARLRIAQSRAGQARGAVAETLGLLARLLTAAEAGGRTGSVIEILALQALAHAAPGHVPQALAALAQALAQAEPEGYVRLFVDEGPPMAALLEGAVKGGIAPNYVRRLLAAFGKAAPTAGGPGQLSAAPQIPEPLSGRELDVLRLLRTELSGPEIAQKLMVSANTFHTHTRNIYGKLGVKNRQDAVRRAEDLNLFNE